MLLFGFCVASALLLCVEISFACSLTPIYYVRCFNAESVEHQNRLLLAVTLPLSLVAEQFAARARTALMSIVGIALPATVADSGALRSLRFVFTVAAEDTCCCCEIVCSFIWLTDICPFVYLCIAGSLAAKIGTASQRVYTEAGTLLTLCLRLTGGAAAHGFLQALDVRIAPSHVSHLLTSLISVCLSIFPLFLYVLSVSRK